MSQKKKIDELRVNCKIQSELWPVKLKSSLTAPYNPFIPNTAEKLQKTNEFGHAYCVQARQKNSSDRDSRVQKHGKEEELITTQLMNNFDAHIQSTKTMESPSNETYS